MSKKFQIHLVLSDVFEAAAQADLQAVLNRSGMVMERQPGEENVFALRTAGQSVFEDKGAVSRLLEGLEQLEGQGIVEDVRRVPEPPVDIHWRR